jgi:hypothetical protein
MLDALDLTSADFSANLPDAYGRAQPVLAVEQQERIEQLEHKVTEDAPKVASHDLHFVDRSTTSPALVLRRGLPLYKPDVQIVMTTSRQRYTPRPRTTVPLKGTTRTTTLHLDHASDLAVAFAQAWHQRAGSLKVPASGVVRRALRVYAEHLEGHCPDEVRAIERAGKAGSPDAQDQQGAWKRLEGINGTDPLPPTPLRPALGR